MQMKKTFKSEKRVTHCGRRTHEAKDKSNY